MGLRAEVRMTGTTSELLVSFPSSDGNVTMSQDREWCRVRLDEEERTIRFHDYAEIYAVPGLYEDYLACDLTRLGAEERERLCAHRPNCLSTVAALGFDEIPPRAFAEAYNLIAV